MSILTPWFAAAWADVAYKSQGEAHPIGTTAKDKSGQSLFNSTLQAVTQAANRAFENENPGDVEHLDNELNMDVD